MDCPNCRQPIVTPVWECHAEQEFCSIECGMEFVMGEPIAHPDWSLNTLLGAKCSFAHTADEFADEYFMGPFIVSDDVVNGWLLFINHKKDGYIFITDLNRMASVVKLFKNGDIRSAASFLLADILDYIGLVVSRGHWTIGPLHICCDDTEGVGPGKQTLISNAHEPDKRYTTFSSHKQDTYWNVSCFHIS